MSGTQQLLLTEGGSAAPNYIEDVFSTYLYTGNGSTQTITNNIDLSTKGGLVWTKERVDNNASGNQSHVLFDTARGVTDLLSTNNTDAAADQGTAISYLTTGYRWLFGNTKWNGSPNTYVSWAFRKQPKFFDVVTYTGTGSARTIAHSLGSIPGCIIVKCTSNAEDWTVYHRSTGSTKFLNLNNTNVAGTNSTRWNNTDPTSTVFTVGTDTSVNNNGWTYVAYLFAHDAGGFGLTGTDNVISCGSYTGNGSATGPVVTLGYEPQWVLIKNATSASYNWHITDNMRGFTASSSGGNTLQLFPNTSGAEANFYYVQPQATGFQVTDTSAGINGSGDTYIYIAIRRGPMKVPTDATKVFSPVAWTEPSGAVQTFNVGFPADLTFESIRASATAVGWVQDRLRGSSKVMTTPSTAAESAAGGMQFDSSVGSYINVGDAFNNTPGRADVAWIYRRAPNFFDEVCYTGTGVARTVTHNLGVAPELMLVKNRTTAGTQWGVYAASQGATKFAYLNTTDAFSISSVMWNDTAPTSSVFTVGIVTRVNGSGNSLVAYLFATCPGVSKVGSYTGTGATQTISCGFTGGARWVMIKRTDTTGDWYVWDTARGMVAGTDPSLLLNSIAAEVNANSIYTTTGGFQIVSTAAGINANGGNYIYLAIA